MTSSWCYSWPKTLNLDDNDDGNDVILGLRDPHVDDCPAWTFAVLRGPFMTSS